MKPNKQPKQQPKQQDLHRNESNPEMQMMPRASTSSASVEIADNQQPPPPSRIEEVTELLTDPQFVPSHFPNVDNVTKSIIKGALVGLLGVLGCLLQSMLGGAPDATNLVDTLGHLVMPLNDTFVPIAATATATIALATTTYGTVSRPSATTRTVSATPPTSTSSHTDPNSSSTQDDPISRLIQEQFAILVNTFAIKFTRYTRTFTVGILTLVSCSQIWSFCKKHLKVDRLGEENKAAEKIKNSLLKLELVLLESYDQLCRLQQQLVYDKYFDEVLFEEFQANVYELNDIKTNISSLLTTLEIKVGNKIVKLTAKNTFASWFGQGSMITGVGMAIWVVIDVLAIGFHLPSLAGKAALTVAGATTQVIRERFFTKEDLKILRKMQEDIEKYSASIDQINKQVTDLTKKLAELTKQKRELVQQMRQENGPSQMRQVNELPQRFSILS